MERQAGPIYCFGDFILDPLEGVLKNGDEPIALTPKAFSVLLLLVENHGHLVEKSTLINTVWADTFVEDAAVSRCIWTIRSALGEASKDDKFIQTIPRRGYRFVAAVSKRDPRGIEREIENETSAKSSIVTRRAKVRSNGNAQQALAAAPRPAGDKVRLFPVPARVEQPAASVDAVPGAPRRIAWYAIAALLLVATLAGGFMVYRRRPVAADAGGGRKLAILPLEPVVAADRDMSVEFPVTESLILKLAESKAFSVRPLNTVRRFTELDQDPVAAGNELEVDYVLASHYQFENGHIRVTSQLFNTHTGAAEHVYRAQTDRASIFQIQDALSNEIGNGVLSKFGKSQSVYAARRGTSNEEAYALYHQALYLVDKFDREDSAKAADLLGEATELDPNYAQAWAVRSYAYCQFAHFGGGEPSKLFVTAEPLLTRALEIDPNNAVAYTIRGTLDRDYHWRFDQAVRDLQHAIELDPNLMLAHRILAGVYYRLGRPSEAVESQKRAVDLNPTSMFDHLDLGEYLAAAGNTEEGIAELRRVTEWNNVGALLGNSALWRIYASRGDFANAVECMLKADQAFGVPTPALAELRRTYDTRGWNAFIHAELDRVITADPDGKYSPSKYYIAQLASQAGEKDLAFKYLDEALRFRLIQFSMVKVDKMLEPL